MDNILCGRDVFLVPCNWVYGKRRFISIFCVEEGNTEKETDKVIKEICQKTDKNP